MNRNRMFLTIVALVFLVSLGACAAGTPTLKLSIKDNVCTMTGPTRLPYGAFVVDLTVDQPVRTETDYVFFAVAEGKTLADLKAWPSEEQSAGINDIFASRNLVGTSETINLRANAEYHGEPLYLGCFRLDPSTGEHVKLADFGPFAVSE